MANLTPSTKRIAHDALKDRLRELNAEKPVDTVKVLKRADSWDSLPDAVKKIIANSTRNRFSTYKKKIASVEKLLTKILDRSIIHPIATHFVMEIKNGS